MERPAHITIAMLQNLVAFLAVEAIGTKGTKSETVLFFLACLVMCFLLIRIAPCRKEQQQRILLERHNLATLKQGSVFTDCSPLQRTNITININV